MRPVIIHFHIFKNAGMSIEWALEKNFTKNFAMEIYGTAFSDIIPIECVVDYLKKNPNVKVFSSQNIRFPLPIENSIDFIPIVFIRHPLDRAFSVFSFNRRNLEERPAALKAKNMTLKEYIQWNIESNNRVMLDAQLQFLSDKTLKTVAERLSSVLERIKNCAIIGVVDRFNESMVVAEEYLKNNFKNIELSYFKQNVSLERKGNLSQRLENDREQIGDQLMKELSEKNSNDLKIYEFANNELNRRIKNVENFELKLSNFNDRCKKLTNQKMIKYAQGIRLEYSPEKKIFLEKRN